MSFTPAPLDVPALRQCLLPFGQSRMLPRAAYVDPAVLAWERERLFRDGWLCLGRCEGAALPGSQLALRIEQRGLLLVRDGSGQLRGFENICRHRGHELLACGQSVNRPTVVCPYHAWTYELSGGLRQARGTTGIANACKDELGLLSVPVAEWGGWVFANLGRPAQPFDRWLGELADWTANWELERLVVGATHHYELQANWKVAVENYHECYHCRCIHPALCTASPPELGGDHRNATGTWTGGYMDLAPGFDTMSLDGRSGGVIFPKLDAQQRRQIHYITLFPGMLLSLHPDYVMTHRLEPVSPVLTRVECQWLFAPEAMARPDFDPAWAVEFWDRTNREDWAAVESVQRGLASERFVPGILAEMETSVHDFVSLVARAYLGEADRLTPPG